MKKLIILFSCLLITSCSTLQGLTADKTVSGCYKTYVLTNQAIGTAYKTTVTLGQEDILTLEQVQKTVKSLDRASHIADQASALCAMDMDAAFRAFAEVDKIINNTQEDTNG